MGPGSDCSLHPEGQDLGSTLGSREAEGVTPKTVEEGQGTSLESTSDTARTEQESFLICDFWIQEIIHTRDSV